MRKLINKAMGKKKRPTPEAASAMAEAVPSNWVTRVDPKSGKRYYGNKVTKRTTFKKPECLRDPSDPLSQLQSSSAKGGSGSGGAKKATPRAKKPKVMLPPKPEELIAKNWVQRTDPGSGRTFWGNLITKRTTWKKPACGDAADAAAAAAAAATAPVSPPPAPPSAAAARVVSLKAAGAPIRNRAESSSSRAAFLSMGSIVKSPQRHDESGTPSGVRPGAPQTPPPRAPMGPSPQSVSPPPRSPPHAAARLQQHQRTNTWDLAGLESNPPASPPPRPSVTMPPPSAPPSVMPPQPQVQPYQTVSAPPRPPPGPPPAAPPRPPSAPPAPLSNGRSDAASSNVRVLRRGVLQQRARTGAPWATRFFELRVSEVETATAAAATQQQHPPPSVYLAFWLDESASRSDTPRGVVVVDHESAIAVHVRDEHARGGSAGTPHHRDAARGGLIMQLTHPSRAGTVELCASRVDDGEEWTRCITDALEELRVQNAKCETRAEAAAPTSASTTASDDGGERDSPPHYRESDAVVLRGADILRVQQQSQSPPQATTDPVRLSFRIVGHPRTNVLAVELSHAELSSMRADALLRRIAAELQVRCWCGIYTQRERERGERERETLSPLYLFSHARTYPPPPPRAQTPLPSIELYTDDRLVPQELAFARTVGSLIAGQFGGGPPPELRIEVVPEPPTAERSAADAPATAMAAATTTLPPPHLGTRVSSLLLPSLTRALGAACSAAHAAAHAAALSASTASAVTAELQREILERGLKVSEGELDEMRRELSNALSAAVAAATEHAAEKAKFAASAERFAAMERTLSEKSHALDDVSSAKAMLNTEVVELRSAIITMHERVITAKANTFAAQQELMQLKLSGAASRVETQQQQESRREQPQPQLQSQYSNQPRAWAQKTPAGGTMSRGGASSRRRGGATPGKGSRRGAAHAAPAFGNAQGTGRNARGTSSRALRRRVSVWTGEQQQQQPHKTSPSGGGGAVAAAPSRRGHGGQGTTSHRRGTYFGTFSPQQVVSQQQTWGGRGGGGGGGSNHPKSPRGGLKPTPRSELGPAATPLPSRLSSAEKALSKEEGGSSPEATSMKVAGERESERERAAVAIAAHVDSSWRSFRSVASSPTSQYQ